MGKLLLFYYECGRESLSRSWAAANGFVGAIVGAAMTSGGSLSFIDTGNATANGVLTFLVYFVVAYILAFIFGFFFISPFRVWKKEREARLKVEADSGQADLSDQKQSNVNSKLTNLPLEVKRALFRVVTGEIEVHQLNVEIRSALEKVGFVNPAVAYDPAKFNEQHRTFIERWFKRNPHELDPNDPQRGSF
jgi:phosphate/sulfate permease